MDGRIIRETRSLCPVCLRNLTAALRLKENGAVEMEKVCPEHGYFRVPIWEGLLDFEAWSTDADPLPAGAAVCCPNNCGLCAEHETSSCCVLLEVTTRCNLRCRYCFADGGNVDADPGKEELKQAIRVIAEKCGGPLLQFSGGEPTLRDDLPELIRYAKEAGCEYTQVNTNGLRLAQDPEYTRALAEAGLDIAFLQFDGTRDEIYRVLRGAPLLETKQKAIRACSDNHIGVTLVPTVVKGVNDDNLGEIVALAASLTPSVRAVHFQPVSYFGRYPSVPSVQDRYTLDRLIADICTQSGISAESFLPSRCDHPLCGFHSSFFVEPDGHLKSLSSVTHSPKCRTSARENREYVGRHWKRAAEPALPKGDLSEEMDFDTFLYRVRNTSLTLSGMVFQDAMNLNLERLHRCSLHVYDRGNIVPFCAKYLTPMV